MRSEVWSKRDSKRLFEIAAKTLDAPAGLFEVFGLCGVGNAKGRPQSERGALNDRHSFGFEQFGDEILVRRNRPARGRRLADRPCAGGIHVERALRLGTGNSLRLIE